MTISLALLALGVGHLAPSIDDFVQTNVQDASFVARVIKADQRELRKINETFGKTYSFESTTIRYRDPFMLRLDGVVDDTTVTYVLNGALMAYKIPRMHLSKTQDVSHAPGRRQTALDFGLIVPSLFKTFLKADFVRMDRATGDPVFDITFQDREDTSRNRIWIDAQRHIVAKREWFNQTGRQLATFIYDEPKKEGGVWFPTRLTVRNTDDAIAGITRYDSIQANTGIAENVFSIEH